jgi:hypothetical protein
VADELKPLGMLLVLDAIWRAVTHPHDRRPRLITVDEDWLLLQSEAGARFLLRTAKLARKWWAELTVATQDIDDVLGSAMITNSATQILMRQAPQAIDQIARVFHLLAGQRAVLTSADRGHGLLLAGQQAAFAAIASPLEDELITTDPRRPHTSQQGRHYLDTRPNSVRRPATASRTHGRSVVAPRLLQAAGEPNLPLTGGPAPLPVNPLARGGRASKPHSQPRRGEETGGAAAS